MSKDVLTFNSLPVTLGKIGVEDGYRLKDEPMLFSCDYEAAISLGNEATRRFAYEAATALGTANIIIDTRVHMLMRGWYPCIPGWHHDDVDRGEDGQPSYPPTNSPRHVMCLLGDDIAPTLFAVGEAEFPQPPAGHGVYEYWHDEVERKIESGSLRLQQAEMGRLIYFDWQTWHRGVKASRSGWRWFARASAGSNRQSANEVRRQVQVYLSADTKGW